MSESILFSCVSDSKAGTWLNDMQDILMDGSSGRLVRRRPVAVWKIAALSPRGGPIKDPVTPESRVTQP